MNKTKFIPLAAGIVLAMTFTFSCSLDEGGDENGGDCNLNGGTVRIGNQVWMSQNLNCKVSGSKCYNDDPANCAKYGRLYNWKTAMNVCPKGWHLPSDAEWEKLLITVDGSGFSALPGGYGYSDGDFEDVGGSGNWWSSYDYDGIHHCLSMFHDYNGTSWSSGSGLNSVRCVQD